LLWIVWIFNNINYSNSWDQNIFPFICVIFNFFHQCLTGFSSLVKFIPRYFILFDTIVNGIVFLIFLPDGLFLGYRNEADFCISILYLATSLNLLVLTVFWWSLVFSIYNAMSSANRGSFTSSFLIGGCLLFLLLT